MNRNLYRELNFIMSEISLPLEFKYFNKGQKIIDYLNEIKDIAFYSKVIQERSNKVNRLIWIINKLNLTPEEIILRWRAVSKLREAQRDTYNKKPTKEGRDNKGVYIGGGGENRNKVRYPSKKRSKRTWKIFYNMFPELAIKDGWDGTKSNKMK